MNDTFNANFYIVTATINPIFFLALTIQGSFYGGLIERINSEVKVMEKKESATSWKDIGSAYLALGLVMLAAAILISGVGSEVIAIIALCYQHSTNHWQLFVLWSTVGIIILTAVVPGLSFVRAFFNLEAANFKNSLVNLKMLIEGITRPNSTSESGLTSGDSSQTADEANQSSRASGSDT